MSLHLFKNVFECIISSILTFRYINSLFYGVTRLVVCHSSILSLVLEDQEESRERVTNETTKHQTKTASITNVIVKQNTHH